jgi:hypothetical protein
MPALVAQFVPGLDHTGSEVKTMVLEGIESNVKSAVRSRYRIWIVPLEHVRNSLPLDGCDITHFKILRRAVPEVDGLEVRIVAIVECPAWCIEFVGELLWLAFKQTESARSTYCQDLRLSFVPLPRLGPVWGVGIDEASSDILQKWLMLLSFYTERVMCAGCDLGSGHLLNEGSVTSQTQ